MELGLPCIGEPPYYLAQSRAGGRKEEKEAELRKKSNDPNTRGWGTKSGEPAIGCFTRFVLFFPVYGLLRSQLQRTRKQKHKRGSLREGREAPPRRCPHLLRFCFRWNSRLI